MDLQSSRQNVKESYSTILPSLRFSSSMSESQFPEQLGGFNSSSGQIITDRISSITSASSNISLTQNIYDEINKLEKTEIKETIFTNVSEKYRPFVMLGFIFFVIEVFARKTIFKSFV